MSKLPELESYYDGMTRGYGIRKKTGSFPFTAAEAAKIANCANCHDALLAACKRDTILADIAIASTVTGNLRDDLTETNILRLAAIAEAEK